MTIEERRRNEDQFPVGMRVLAVDDDPVCLKLLESLLSRCQYNVTTTGQAITALRLLRENKNKFDLVISDVHMPDMDGFKLLELVGLEMDLPVIMLSANGERQAVMKGITHGACDYLLKPVRIEELKNIWQHVIRRRKFDKSCQNNDDHNALYDGEDGQKTQIIDSEDGQQTNGSSGKLIKKRKDQNEDDECDTEDEMQDNDEQSAQKKPRVVWTVELHRKFVAAVNQLGIDKAVPRKILDLMNVDKLTRENVASHLQKYRLYLKRLSTVNQQANFAAAFGGRSSSNVYMASLNGFRGYQTLGGSKQPPVFTSFHQNGVLGQINTPSSTGMQGSPLQAIHLGSMTKITNYNVNDPTKFQSLNLPRNDQSNLLNSMPTVLQLEGSQRTATLQEVKSHFATAIPNNGATASLSQSGMNNSMPLRSSIQRHPVELCNSSSVAAAVSISKYLEADLQKLSQFPNVYGCNDTGQVAVTSTQHSADPATKLASLKQGDSSIKIEGNYSLAPNAISEYPNSMKVQALHGPVGSSIQNQGKSLFDGHTNAPTSLSQDCNFTNFRLEDNFMQKINDFDYSAISSTSAYSSFPRLNDGTTQYQSSERDLFNSKIVTDAINSSARDSSLHAQNCVIDKPCSQLLGLDEFDVFRSQNGLDSTGCSFDELYAMIKLEQDGDKSMDMDFGSDVYSLG